MGAPRARRSRSRCPGPATSRSASAPGYSLAVTVEHADDLGRHLGVVAGAAVDLGDVLHPPHPRQLAAGVAPLSPLHRLRITRQQLVEADRRSGCARGAGRRGATDLLLGTEPEYPVDP